MAHKINDDCIACGACMPECPVDAISEGEKYSIDPDTCIDCGACVAACPVGAIEGP
ncbi:MAG: 4Fe-4S binding protein [Candidatus Aegiribacteria sp.]